MQTFIACRPVAPSERRVSGCGAGAEGFPPVPHESSVRAHRSSITQTLLPTPDAPRFTSGRPSCSARKAGRAALASRRMRAPEASVLARRSGRKAGAGAPEASGHDALPIRPDAAVSAERHSRLTFLAPRMAPGPV